MKQVIKEVLDEHARKNFYSDAFRSFLATEIEKRIGESGTFNRSISSNTASTNRMGSVNSKSTPEEEDKKDDTSSSNKKLKNLSRENSTAGILDEVRYNRNVKGKADLSKPDISDEKVSDRPSRKKKVSDRPSREKKVSDRPSRRKKVSGRSSRMKKK